MRARYTENLIGTTVTADEIPSLIDEVPLLAIVATAAEGTTTFEGVGELRVKESDRLAAIADGVNAFEGGAVVTDDDVSSSRAAIRWQARRSTPSETTASRWRTPSQVLPRKARP